MKKIGRIYSNEQIIDVVPVRYKRPIIGYGKRGGVKRGSITSSIGFVLPTNDDREFIATFARSRVNLGWYYEFEDVLNLETLIVKFARPDLDVWFWKGIPYCKYCNVKNHDNYQALTASKRDYLENSFDLSLKQIMHHHGISELYERIDPR
jgi:hypothetical protein